MDIRMESVAVIGAGTMGTGIAQVAASAGHDVLVIDRDPDSLERGRNAFAWSLDGAVKRQKITPAKAGALGARVRWSLDLGAAAGSGLLIEAIVERLDAKRQLFATLAAIVGRDAVLASNTSSFSIAAIAEGVGNPTRVVGLHFFNPVPAMKLVEVVAGRGTAPLVVEAATALMRRWGKHAVVVRDVPGFIVNRVARPFYSEAFVALCEGIDAAVIDAALTESGGFRMGPLALADMIGHDVNYAAASSVFEGMRPGTRFRPQPCQARLVERGLLGRKTGRGVYDYSAALPQPDLLSGRPARRIRVAPGETPLTAPGLETDPSLAPGTMSVDGVIAASGDGRRLIERDGIGILLDHHRAPQTSRALVATVRDGAASKAAAGLAAALGKALLLVPDRPGQIVLRTLAQLSNGAADALRDGVAPASAIDEAMVHGAGYPSGPLDWARATGAQALTRALSHIASGTGDPIYKPSDGLKLL